jgi:hypothetical protein
VGPRAGLDAVAREENPNSCQESNPDRLARDLVAILTELRELIFTMAHKSQTKRTFS